MLLSSPKEHIDGMLIVKKLLETEVQKMSVFFTYSQITTFISSVPLILHMEEHSVPDDSQIFPFSSILFDICNSTSKKKKKEKKRPSLLLYLCLPHTLIPLLWLRVTPMKVDSHFKQAQG